MLLLDLSPIVVTGLDQREKRLGQLKKARLRRVEIDRSIPAVRTHDPYWTLVQWFRRTASW
jgi:hypothetical protein